MTPDGISTEDWDRVHELALDVVNSSAEDDLVASASASLRLRELLDELQEKYGPLPSLLATRGDYVDSPVERDYWFSAAYEEAKRRGDAKNLVWIASSLATLHVEGIRDPVKGAEWLTLLEQHLVASPDESEAEEAHRLRGILQSTNQQPQNNGLKLTKRGG
jgi:hypothetical protein